MPVSDFMPYTWYNTPNIHFCTFEDFEALCSERRAQVLDRLAVDHMHRHGGDRHLPCQQPGPAGTQGRGLNNPHWRRQIMGRLSSFLLVACLSTTALAADAIKGERKEVFGDTTVHYSTFISTFLQPDIAKAAQLAMLGDTVQLRSIGEFSSVEPEETGLSFVENAILKARNAARISGLPALADDSGLAVDFLGGAPGIYSARYADGQGDAANNAKLLEVLKDVPDAERGAQFVCVLALVRHADDPLPILCEGLWHGRILHQASGAHGFGYDPLFWVPERDCSSAELSPADKNQISHRARAMSLLRQRLGLQ
uniref:dITP/XTP pyrophosphatase n=2 Tax=cellular organisms TaxID=131567 RepID=A0A1I7Z935_9BILA